MTYDTPLDAPGTGESRRAKNWPAHIRHSHNTLKTSILMIFADFSILASNHRYKHVPDVRSTYFRLAALSGTLSAFQRTFPIAFTTPGSEPALFWTFLKIFNFWHFEKILKIFWKSSKILVFSLYLLQKVCMDPLHCFVTHNWVPRGAWGSQRGSRMS